MGNRGQVHIVDTDVWLYTHWGATALPETVREAIAREARWNDYEYLTRIIFDQMVGEGQGSTTGHGIGRAQHGDVQRVVHVDCDAREITVEQESVNFTGEELETYDTASETYTFEEYANLEPGEAEWPQPEYPER